MLNLEGRELGGCRLIRKIGEGGMGEVYLAEQMRVGNRQVAVKVMRPDPDAYDVEAKENAKRRFEREAATLGKLEHPNILPIYDSGVEGEYFYIVMRYATDGSLVDCIRGRSPRKLTLPLDVKLTVDIVSQVASALQFTHDKGVVHRDVKPANVLTQDVPGEQWRMLLADFGVARGLDNTSQRTQVTGTITYMAPEQFHGEYSPATDQYALAVMTYQFLTGRPPFEGEMGAVMRGHMNEQPPSLRALNPAIPADIEAAVLRALSKEPQQRFQSVTAYAQALQTGLDAHEKPPALPADIASPVKASGAAIPRWPSGEPIKGQENEPAKRGGLGRAWLVALAALVLIASVIGASAYVNKQNQTALTAQETQTAQAHLTQTAGAPTATVATTTTTPTGTVAGATNTPAPLGTPTLPTGVGALVFDSAAPTCDSNDPVKWSKGTNAQPSCPGGSEVALTSTTQGTLACLSAMEKWQPNGYITATVSAQSGNVELGFRQGTGEITSSGFQITGYYLAVNAQQGVYTLYKVDQTGKVVNLALPAPLPAPLPATFQMAALFDGTTLTAFVNGQALPSVQDTDFANGWVAACTDGSATFSHVQLYAAS